MDPRSQVGYHLWGRKESDTTEQLHFYFQKYQAFSVYFCVASHTFLAQELQVDVQLLTTLTTSNLYCASRLPLYLRELLCAHSAAWKCWRVRAQRAGGNPQSMRDVSQCVNRSASPSFSATVLRFVLHSNEKVPSDTDLGLSITFCLLI